MTCRALVVEMLQDAVDNSNSRLCKEYVEVVVVNKAWNKLEHDRILREIQTGGEDLRIDVEKSLRDVREVEEAEKALIREEQLDRARFQKIKALKLLWKKRREESEYKMMVKKLDELSLSSMDKEITEIENLIKAMILVEADGVKEVLPIIDMDDVPMFDTTLSGARALEIKWLEEMEVTPSLGPSLPACQEDDYDKQRSTQTPQWD